MWFFSMLPFSFLLCFFFKDACSLKEIWEWKIPAIISPTVYPCSREFDMNKLGVCLWNGVVSGYRTVVVWSLPFRQSWFSRSISPSEATFWLDAGGFVFHCAPTQTRWHFPLICSLSASIVNIIVFKAVIIQMLYTPWVLKILLFSFMLLTAHPQVRR